MDKYKARSREHAADMRFLEDNDKYFEDIPSTPFSASARPASSSTNIVTPTGFAPFVARPQNRLGDPSTPTPSRIMASPGHATSAAQPPLSVRLDSDPGLSSMQPLSTVPDLSRKRHRDSNGSSDEPAAKSLRATPSPAMTGTTTPSSLDSLEIDEGSELFRLLGNTGQDMREMRKEHKAHEAALRARQEQEKNDAKFARELEESMLHVEPELPSSRSGPNGSNYTPAQTYFDDSGRIQRRRPQAPVTPSPKSLPPALFKQESGHFAYSTPSRATFSRPYTKPALIPKNAEFIDLEDDDELDERFNQPAGHPSSDLVEIGSSDYRDSLSVSAQRRLPPAKTEPHISTVDGVGLSYQNQPNRAALAGWGNTAGNMLQTGMVVAQNIYDTGRQLLSPYDPAYSPTSAYGVPGYGMAGSPANPITFSHDGYGGFSGMSEAYNALTAHIDVSDPRRQDLVRDYMERADYLDHDPRKTTEELKALLENIRPDEELNPKDREGTPDAMKNPLYEHQKLGLAWLIKMEEGSNKGGILADDMGLGKTIQALALMVSRRSKDPNRKTTLIVAPVALMRQWEKEIRNKLRSGREHRLTTFIMHGAHRGASWEQLKTYDVVLTTFGTLATEIKRKQGIDLAKRANPNWRPTGKADQLPLLGDECKWYRVIIDEAQCIKNKNTHAAIGASYLQALSRFCMTGTPMMNNVGELYSLIRFLRIKPYDVHERFNRDFTKPLKSQDGNTAKAMRMLQALLKAILLRRTKKSTIDGKPILNLPERTTEAQEAAFDDDEREFYRAVETQTRLQFNKYLKAGTVGKNYSNVLVLLLRLRQACCHPHLLKDFGQPSGATELTMEEMIGVAKELAPDVIARIQERTGTEELNGLECPVCFDTAENGLIIIPCGHSTCTECFARITDPAQAIANGNGDGAANDAKCPNCRGKINLRKVINHEAFKKAHMPGLDLGIAALENDASTTDDSESEDDSEDDSGDDLKDFIVYDDETTDGSGEEAEGYGKGKTPFEKSAKRDKKSKKPKKDKGKGKAGAPDKPPKKSLAELKKEGQRNARAHRKYIARLRKEYEPSAKIEKTVDLLRATQEAKEGEKTIIFSQFTSLLDLLEVPIDAEGWRYKRYDGSMSAKARDDAVTEFTEIEDCRIMLVSLKAGNAGLNLVAASQVIIFDPFWNPYIEEQAIDRAHRIGQLRPVKVHRILVPDTVEDRILDLQKRKRELIEGALDENASRNISRLGTRELAFLFGVSHA